MSSLKEANPDTQSDSDNDQPELRSPADSSLASLLIAADSSAETKVHDDDTVSLDEDYSFYPVYFDRTYHKYKEGSYHFPNDRQEQERMDLQFRLIQWAKSGRLFCAPVKSPRKILDVGTGTGIWAITLADENSFPDAQIIGIDLSPIQPRDVPPNVYFELGDCSDSDWARDSDSFAFIFCQSLFGSLQDYQHYLITARKYLEPGNGWIECCEMDPVPFSDDNTMPDDWGFKRWIEWMEHACARNNRQFRVAARIEQWMKDAGYVDVRKVVVKIPIGPWPKDSSLKKMGREWRELILASLSTATKMVFSKAYDQITSEDIEVFLAQIRASFKQKGVHAYQYNYTVYGRKPSHEEEVRMGRMAPPPLPRKPDK